MRNPNNLAGTCQHVYPPTADLVDTPSVNQEEYSMNQFEISMFGIKLTARGAIGIAGAVCITALVLAHLWLSAN
jgi:hypothetical protein